MEITMIKPGRVSGIDREIGHVVNVDEMTGIKLVKRGYASVDGKIPNTPKTGKPKPSRTADKPGPQETREPEEPEKPEKSVDELNTEELVKLAADKGMVLPDGEIEIETLRGLVRKNLMEVEQVDLKELNADELRAYAADNDIEIPGDVKSRKDLLAYIAEQKAV